jgi:hypothetical protein
MRPRRIKQLPHAGGKLTACQLFPNNLRDPPSMVRSTEMTRRERQKLELKLA